MVVTAVSYTISGKWNASSALILAMKCYSASSCR